MSVDWDLLWGKFNKPRTKPPVRDNQGRTVRKQKEYCLRGHQRTIENVRRGDGMCIACERLRQARVREAQRATL